MRRRSSDFTSIPVLQVASPLIAAVVIAFSGVMSWNDTLHRAESEAAVRAKLLESQIVGTTSAQLVLHDAIKVRLAEIDPAAVRDRPFHEYLKALFETTSGTYGIGLVASDGRLLASSGEYPARSQIDGRAYLDEISTGTTKVVDRILLANGQVDAMVSATSVTLGATRAALVTAWPVEPLIEFTSGLADRPGHRAFVLRADGHILVMSDAAKDTGDQLAHLPLASDPSQPVALVGALPAPDGEPALLAYRTSSAHPLSVAYSISMRSVQGEWLLGILPVWAFAAAGGLFGFILFGTIRDNIATRMRRTVSEQRAVAAEKLARHRKDLLREMTHRIKNNLAIISAILRVEGRGKSPMQLVDLAGRIDAVAALHDMLYRADDGVTADLGKLLEAIATNPAILPPELGVDVSFDLLADVPLDSSVATTVAMIVSEIVTNSVKHAFLGAPDPRLSISMAKAGDTIDITVRDNGPGSSIKTDRRSGSELILALATGAGISLHVEVDGGTVHRLRLQSAVGLQGEA